MDYAELQVTSNYSFLRGASHVEEIAAQAAALGLRAVGIVDRNSLAGIARAHQRMAEAGVRLIVGCRLDLADGTPLLLYPRDRPAYSRLCRLLTLGKSRTGKGGCQIDWDDIDPTGLIAVRIPAAPDEDLARGLRRLRDLFGADAYLALTRRRLPGEHVRLAVLHGMGHAAGVLPVVTGDVLYHDPRRQPLQDVVTCIREGCTIDELGLRREHHAERHLRSAAHMIALHADHPDAVARTQEIAAACSFSLSELRYQYPDETDGSGRSSQEILDSLTWEGAHQRYGGNPPDDVVRQLRHELSLIAQMQYAPYFLTVRTIVCEARRREILCQGRGSAANSAVCYVLGITEIDPLRSGLLFERFISAARHEPPDIDVDFEHERREDIIQWVYDHYGRRHAALCATVNRYRARGAVREVGKALGLTEDVTGALAGQVWGWSDEGVQTEHAAALNLNTADPRLRMTLALARELIGFPRHLGTHPGGFVLTQDRLDDLVPIEPAAMVDRQVIEWDKDDIDHLRFMKVDVLGLGMLGCMRRFFDLLDDARGQRLTLSSIPAEDPATYAMIRRADTLGVFQIESRAQMSMLPRMKPTTFYDLVIEVAIVRPGPIQGDMVHPYLRRREGREPVTYIKPELEAVLKKTLGVPLFQEQAMKIAIVCAGFSAEDADRLRRSMATFKMTGGVGGFRDKLIDGMVERGYPRDFAERTFSQIEGFGSYGFPESHAASFALIAYASSWAKCHHPDVFAAALLNSQPMGFYAPAQIVRDAAEHGVPIRPVCVTASHWDCTLEAASGRYLALRLGLRMVKGLAENHAKAILAAREQRSFTDIPDIWRRSGVPIAALDHIAAADGFTGLGADRRRAQWIIRGLSDRRLPLFDDIDRREPEVQLPAMSEGRQVVEDYGTVGLTLRAHPVSFLREELAGRGMIPCSRLAETRDGRRVEVAGIVLVRQKPGSAKGVMFITLEDETGIANLVVWPSIFERQRSLILSAGMISCRGRVQREGEVVHVVTEQLTDLSALLRSVGQRQTPFPLVQGRGDEAHHGGAPDPRERRALGRPPRDIYVPDFKPPEAGTQKGIKVPTRDFR